jgi:hypothetical protein
MDTRYKILHCAIPEDGHLEAEAFAQPDAPVLPFYTKRLPRPQFPCRVSCYETQVGRAGVSNA